MANARSVNDAGVQLLADEEGFLRRFTWPVLLWETPPASHDAPLLLATDPGQPHVRSEPGKPVYFEV